VTDAEGLIPLPQFCFWPVYASQLQDSVLQEVNAGEVCCAAHVGQCGFPVAAKSS
jgi:hypothetical protein